MITIDIYKKYRAQYKIALPQGGKGAACKIPCPLAAHLQAAPRTVQNRPRPPANFVDGRRPRANGRLPRHFRRPLGWRFLKIALPEGGENDVAAGRSLSGDGRQRNLQAAPLPPSARAILYCAGGRLQMGGEGGMEFCRRPPCRPGGGRFCTVLYIFLYININSYQIFLY